MFRRSEHCRTSYFCLTSEIFSPVIVFSSNKIIAKMSPQYYPGNPGHQLQRRAGVEDVDRLESVRVILWEGLRHSGPLHGVQTLIQTQEWSDKADQRHEGGDLQVQTGHVDDDDVVKDRMVQTGALLPHEAERGLHHPQAVVHDLVPADTGEQTWPAMSDFSLSDKFPPFISTLPIGNIQTGLPESSKPARPPGRICWTTFKIIPFSTREIFPQNFGGFPIEKLGQSSLLPPLKVMSQLGLELRVTFLKQVFRNKQKLRKLREKGGALLTLF